MLKSINSYSGLLHKSKWTSGIIEKNKLNEFNERNVYLSIQRGFLKRSIAVLVHIMKMR